VAPERPPPAKSSSAADASLNGRSRQVGYVRFTSIRDLESVAALFGSGRGRIERAEACGGSVSAGRITRGLARIRSGRVRPVEAARRVKSAQAFRGRLG
jgi:hypothetical protein